MTSHILVCPADDSLLERLRGHRLVLLANGVEEMSRALEMAGRWGVNLHCLLVHSEAPLAYLPFREEWQGIPLAVYAPGLGPFREFVNQIGVLRKLNIRIYLPADDDKNYTSLRIISSLGIETAVVIEQNSADWERLTDLMTYSLLGRVEHAPIEPFTHIATQYARNERTDHSAVYFDDPNKYLHVDSDGHVALSRADLAAGRFVMESIDQLSGIEQNPAYQNRLEDWRECFLEEDGCAYCQAWRVCLGRYAETTNGRNGCRQLFVELMDVAEQYQALKNRKTNIWQP